ncbi:WD40-repeat-containing domain protein [Kalmanozyma brasiliensis GHG001]|uniref:WD40-repeat-containing domain protein n=1 Tax=Kalmanozyma brasiliensis (strain GHG001) TaxID=1365824 RepID=UPI0028681F78|nr:WD40-repeat-containing domain protein [Kalmanozyma brasiliensis GHG001]KAF6767662.1 WD40-repeat-containing domain protein [Kalmanozyma brasiliensis GHG001]
MQATESAAARSLAAVDSGYPTPPELHVDVWSDRLKAGNVKAPHLLVSLDGPSERLLEASKRSVNDRAHRTHKDASNDFYRRACWAPDGSALLALTESQQKHVIGCSSAGSLEPCVSLNSPSPLLDAIWYPVPALEEPTAEHHPDGQGAALSATWCFAESHRDLPTRLTSSRDGSSRANYSIMNHVEKFVGPHSLVFSPDLSRLYCGLYSALAVFPLSRPGLNTHSLIPLTSGKRSVGGQRGIVSALAAAAHPSEPSQELVAVGTFSGNVAVYGFDPTTFPEPTEHTAVQTTPGDDGEPLAQSSCLAGWREVEGDGITQLKLHPLTPYVLFVASRRSDSIYVYDIRYLIGDTSRWQFRPLAQPAGGVRTAHLLARLQRPGGSSNQRLYFDVDWAGRWLATGDQEGIIHIWRIDTGRFTDHADVDGKDGQEPEALELTPDLSWKAHGDAVGSVSFHPYQSWLASVSGSRHWPDVASEDSESEGESDSDASSSSLEAEAADCRRRAWSTNDSSLKVWDFSHPPIPSS